jgi:hypothetical protein
VYRFGGRRAARAQPPSIAGMKQTSAPSGTRSKNAFW